MVTVNPSSLRLSPFVVTVGVIVSAIHHHTGRGARLLAVALLHCPIVILRRGLPAPASELSAPCSNCHLIAGIPPAVTPGVHSPPLRSAACWRPLPLPGHHHPSTCPDPPPQVCRLLVASTSIRPPSRLPALPDPPPCLRFAACLGPPPYLSPDTIPPPALIPPSGLPPVWRPLPLPGQHPHVL